MHPTLTGLGPTGLERSCERIRLGAGAPGIELADVRLRGRGFAPHRHDTYAVGVTTAGVQVFRYRGRRHVCLPGQVHVLHPDEVHDGGPGTDAGFAYRILYVEPELVRAALGGGSLPFVGKPVHDPGPATAGLAHVLGGLDDPLGDLARTDAALAVAILLRALSGTPEPDGRIDLAAVARVREHLAAHASEQTPAAELERIAGMDRYTLARHFRRAYGTSPDRYRTMRRLALARAEIAAGAPLARAAADAGFADQSHMTRQFVRAYGLTPGRWARLAGHGGLT
ncbi:MAG TPA: AraC family transcriptional regulator [Gaiellales bacterium]|nr:AraC family transcriptional regulator [Gaiellales bacterium]